MKESRWMKNNIMIQPRSLLVIQKCTQTNSKTKFVSFFSYDGFFTRHENALLAKLVNDSKQACPILVVCKPPTKPMEIISQGLKGTCKGWYRPCFPLLGLMVQQIMHPLVQCYILLHYV